MGTDWREKDVIENRWEIHHILGGPGHSGMGVVYVVYDREWHLALAAKTFQDQVFAGDPAIAELFTKEASAWINLDDHQNVVRAVYVRTIFGKPFLFLEYVSGGDLSAWIGTPRLSEDLSQVLKFAIQFSDGMIHAQAKGIAVHRDIKPENCLVTLDGTLKVTDFGLAKVLDAAGSKAESANSDVHSLTIGRSRTGRAVGTPTHMAPEQFVDAKHVDVKADIYSFGVMLFQMLAGRLPFEGHTWQELARQHMREPVPSVRADHSAVRGVLERCLAKEAGARFVDFGELRERLADLYAEVTGATAPTPAEGRELNAGGWSNKAASLYELDRPEEALACYDRALEIDPRLAGAWYNKGINLDGLSRKEEAIACYDRALEINPGYVEAWYNKGNTLVGLSRKEEAIACYDRALEINPRDKQPWRNKGRALSDLGRPDEALVCYDRVLEIEPHDDATLSDKGILLAGAGKQEEALTCFSRALEINPGYVEALNNKGLALADLGREKEALPYYERASEIDPDAAAPWFNKGKALVKSERFSEALSCFQESQRLGLPQARAAIALCRQLLDLGVDEGRQPLAERQLGDEKKRMLAVDSFPSPHRGAEAERAARLNIEYQQHLAYWKSLSWFKRLRARKPQPPTGI